MSMYCDQCEQTFRGVACTEVGVCGKNADMESLQKILLYGLKGMASYKAPRAAPGQDRRRGGGLHRGGPVRHRDQRELRHPNACWNWCSSAGA